MFATTTLSTLMVLLSVPITDTNTTTVSSILTGIEAINSGVFVTPIETLIGQITALQTNSLLPATLAQSGMIKADVVEWRGGGAGAGAVAQYNVLMNKLYALLGLQNPRSQGISMYRSDRYSLTGGSGYSIYDDWRLIAW